MSFSIKTGIGGAAKTPTVGIFGGVGGGRRSATESHILGKRPDRVFIDDPYNAEAASLVPDAPVFTKEQLAYAGNAGINYFLKYDPIDTIDTYKTPFLNALSGRTQISRVQAIELGLDVSKLVRVSADSDYFYKPPKRYPVSVIETKKGKPVAYKTVGVRFIDGPNLAKVYTYQVPKKAKLHLGQEVVVPTDKTGSGYVTNSIAVVVELHKSPQDLFGYNYKFIVGTVKPL